MENNVDLELTFNPWDISVQKTLNTPKSAIFADSTFLDWGQKLSKHAKDLHCMVRLKNNKTGSRRNSIDNYVYLSDFIFSSSLYGPPMPLLGIHP